MIRILIADDHVVVRQGLRALLVSKKYDIQVIGEAEDGLQAVQLALDLQPDVILMDLQMPRKNGLDAIQEILQHTPDARILVLSSFGNDERVTAAMRAGAYGYLLKDSSPKELVSAIKAVALGHISLPKELSAVLLGGAVEQAATSSEPMHLTKQEKRILHYLATGISNQEIAAYLFVSLSTVRTHVSNILGKLNLKNRTQAALYAREHGLDEEP